MKIKDCIALVTGGASGLGESTVRNIVAGGGRAVILDLQADKGEALANELDDKVIFANTDITSEDSVKAAIQKTLDAFGSLNAVVNCAGIGSPMKVLGKEGPMPLAFFEKVIQINLTGTINVIRLAIEQMVKNSGNEDGEKGVIVNTSSVAAYDGQVGQPAYAASKAGVVGMTLPLARECAEYGPGYDNLPRYLSYPNAARFTG